MRPSRATSWLCVVGSILFAGMWAGGVAPAMQFAANETEPNATKPDPAKSQSVAQLRRDYQLLEQQCLQLAQQLRNDKSQQKSPSSNGVDKSTLTQLVERVFAARQLLQRAELAENMLRLEKIQQTIEEREGLKAQIVQRRVDELLNTNLNWLKNDVVYKALPEADIAKPAVEPGLPGVGGLFNALPAVNLADKPGVPSMPTSSSLAEADLLRISPAQMRELLEEKSRNVKTSTMNLDGFSDRLLKEGRDNDLIDHIKLAETNLKWNQRDLQFATLQYDETIKYLEAAVSSVKDQIKLADEEYDVKMALFNRGSVSRSEVNAALARPRQLQLELQRVESLLKLYRAAGDIPELNEVRRRSGSRLGFNIRDAKLGVPTWLEGNGGLTHTPKGYTIVSNGQMGLVAQILFSNIPGHANSTLFLKVEAPVSSTEILNRLDLQAVREVSFTDADIRAAIEGKPLRKSFVMRPDGSMAEKSAESETANDEKDPVVATIELGRPETQIQTK